MIKFELTTVVLNVWPKDCRRVDYSAQKGGRKYSSEGRPPFRYLWDRARRLRRETRICKAAWGRKNADLGREICHKAASALLEPRGKDRCGPNADHTAQQRAKRPWEGGTMPRETSPAKLVEDLSPSRTERRAGEARVSRVHYRARGVCRGYSRKHYTARDVNLYSRKLTREIYEFLHERRP